MPKEVTFISLIGEHSLTGVDMGSRRVDYGTSEECNTISFTLDGKTYMATEDPSDGYRSSMASLISVKGKCKNKFRSHRVIAHCLDDFNDVLELVDCKTGKSVLRVGTDHDDSYYPHFVAKFMPENMAANTKVK